MCEAESGNPSACLMAYCFLMRLLVILASLPWVSSCRDAPRHRESPGQPPSSTASVASERPAPCSLHLADSDFEACNLDISSNPLCFHFAVRRGSHDGRRGCVPGRARLVIESSRRNQTDELVVTTSLVSRDPSSALVELRLESMVGSQGFFAGAAGAVVGTIHTTARGAERFDLGSALLPSALNVRTAEQTDIIY